MNQRDEPRNRSQRASPAIGQLLLEWGKLTPRQAEDVLLLQRESDLRFGEAAVRLGYVGQSDIDLALATQFSYPYLTTGDPRLDRRLVAAYQPFSAEVESLRSLRCQLLLRRPGSGHTSVAVASPNESCARHQLAANLAIVFSQLGEKTLLIDADLRQSSLGAMFGLRHAPGLAEILSDRADMGSIQRLEVLSDLSILPAGAQVPNPQELLSRTAFGQLLHQAAQQYEVIIVNTVPYSVAADIQIAAAHTRGCIIAVETGSTSLEEVRRLQNALASVQAEILGTVLQRTVIKKR